MRISSPCGRAGVLGLGLVLGVTSCDRVEALVDQHRGNDDEIAIEVDETPAKPEKTPEIDPKAKPKSESRLGQAAEPVPLLRARRRGEFLVRGTKHLGFNLDAIDGLVAQAGAIEIPEWSVASSDNVDLMRDDDLETAWTCTPEQFRTCAVGFHLVVPGEVRAIRLFAASHGKAFEQRARPAKVRVHTDDGWFDADLDDGPIYNYIVFGKPTKTRNLAIEFLTFHGRAKAGMLVAELEVYGRGGTPRDPMVLDPEQMVVEFDRGRWSKSHHGQTLGASFLETLGKDGKGKRVLPGTAIHGRATDEILLVEDLESTDCRTHKGMFYLLNRTTRVMVPIGDLGSMGGQIFRFAAGTGFAGGYVDDIDARVTGVVLEEGTYQQRRTQRLAKVTGPAFLDSVGIEPTPLVRGGVPSTADLEGCVRGSDDSLAELRSATGGKLETVPGAWMVCDVGGGSRVFLSDHGPCGKNWEITILDKGGKVAAKRQAKRKGARLRVRRRSATELWVEVGGADDATEVLMIDAKAIRPVTSTALAVSAPAVCREKCDATLFNNADPR